jgi:hypothetical protein
MPVQVIQKKFPLVRCPTAGFIGIAIKRGRERGDEIECATEIWQRLEGANPPGEPIDAEKLNQFVGKRIIANVHTEAAMAKLFRQKKEKTGATAKIENLPWFRTIEFQLLDARTIDLEPMGNIRVLRVTSIGTTVALLNCAQPLDVDFGDDLIHIEAPAKFHEPDLKGPGPECRFGNLLLHHGLKLVPSARKIRRRRPFLAYRRPHPP